MNIQFTRGCRSVFLRIIYISQLKVFNGTGNRRIRLFAQGAGKMHPVRTFSGVDVDLMEHIGDCRINIHAVVAVSRGNIHTRHLFGVCIGLSVFLQGDRVIPFARIHREIPGSDDRLDRRGIISVSGDDIRRRAFIEGQIKGIRLRGPDIVQNAVGHHDAFVRLHRNSAQKNTQALNHHVADQFYTVIRIRFYIPPPVEALRMCGSNTDNIQNELITDVLQNSQCAPIDHQISGI